ncbi:MAG TPA: bifunctional salicylyl-CoA 5-hydroxylase/oxidoreductase [Gemmatimonadales bacterium]|nr:bifunctional salicylyl-CoA 5-hydroxylase/oxidoreductase [Gemmatimonadales bacterium]HRZ09023.1 bifunctional salicylyl-CoA 5-hydroxylase/oxidoreductase [Gemmatimonadales bacterium]
MKVAIIGGGPGGLYLAILLRRANPATQVVIYERNRIEDTFGFGVVLSDATEGILAEADDVTHAAMSAVLHRWGDIDVHINGECITSGGHGFSGISRKVLLEILCDRARALGAELRELTEAPPVEALLASHDLVVAADGVNSAVREARKAAFGASVDLRPNRFVWLGTSRPFPSFFFSFRQNAHGLWRVHAYQYAEGESTFIVETTEAAWQAAGLKENDEAATIAYCEALFTQELEGHRLVANRSIWRQFPTVRCDRWSDGRLVLLGDAAHTAHFSVGSGTKLAMEDAIELSRVLQGATDVAAALAMYEEQRRPGVASVQRAAQASLEWFEATERYDDLQPLQFAYSLLTRSLRITHENLRTRDPAFVERVERWYADKAGVAPVPGRRSPPPFLTPFKLRDLLLTNRVVVSPMCQYSAVDGVPNDWHLQHLASRAVGGAGLVMTEMTDVSAEGRITPGCTGIYNGAQVAAWRRIVDFVRAHAPDTRIGMQLGHAGRKAATKLMWEGDNEPLPTGAWPIMSASAVPWKKENQVPRAMTRGDMDRVHDEFVGAVGRAVEAGFDLIEVHLAHGYLLASFISPLTNRRTDEYGGSLANRMRFPLEVLRAVRAAWPAERPLTARVSATDWHPDGLTGAESVEVARLIGAAGVDAVDVSAGQTVPDQRPIYGRAFQTPFADRIRHEAGMATMAVGNIQSHEDVNAILAAGRADLVLMARAHLWDPYWTRHAAYALGHPMQWPPQYESLDNYNARI